ncbi:hypothetical protein GGR57DRAFT_519746 [Xylariaceae sp. FL1272]|nr:hypothetical protein GGR57DRAFT_519746 [Xylariaceae sp. FL1272]
MESGNPDEEVFTFVRKHSWQVADTLPHNEAAQKIVEWDKAQILKEKKRDNDWIEWQEWLRFGFEEQGDRTALLDECKSLYTAWKEFQQRFPESVEINTIPGEFPSIRTLQSSVSDVIREWELKKNTGLGKVREYLANYCDTLVAHSNLFAVIPQGDKFTSLFVGVTSSLIKAVARHSEIAEGFARALSDINMDIRFACRQGAICPTERIKELAMMMYIKYFNFLCHAMEWYSSRSRRIKSAFNQNFYSKEVQLKTKDIRDLLNSIKQEASLTSQQKINATFNQVMELATAQDLGTLAKYLATKFEAADQNRDVSNQEVMRRLELFSAQLSEAIDSRDKLREEAHNAAMASVERMLYERRQITVQDGDGVIADREFQATLIPGREEIMYHRQEMESKSRRLQTYINAHDRANDTLARPLSGDIPGEIVIKLQSWMSAASSKALWILGRPFAPIESEQTTAAAHIVFLAESAGVPCVSYFFGPPQTTDPAPQPATFQARMISLSYSLVRQLLLQVPGQFPGTSELQVGLDGLNGSPESVAGAIELIRMLIALGPKLMIVVVDGLHMLDNPHGDECHVREILNLFATAKEDRIIKLLMTTRGFSPFGVDFAPSDRLDCSILARRKPGAGLPGGMSLRSVRLS